MRDFMTPRKLEFKGNPNPTAAKGEKRGKTAQAEGNAEEEGNGEAKSGRGTTKKERKEAKMAEKKAEKLAVREKKGEADTETAAS